MSVATRTARVWSRKKKGFVTATITLEVDWQLLAEHLAAKAVNNKSGRSAIQGGIVTGRLVKVDE